MNVKTVIAVTLGLLFQWAQLAHAAVSTEAGRDVCPVQCECCADLPSCPCVSDGEPVPERAPLPAMPESVKLPAAKLCETRVSLEDAPVPQTTGHILVSASAEPVAGYAGVSLAVAFCSYLM